MNLYAANRQWAARPADERFWNLEDMLKAAQGFFTRGREKVLPVSNFRAKPAEDDVGLTLVGVNGGSASFTNFAFGQLCRFVAPVDVDDLGGKHRGKSDPEYLCRLPARIAADALNHDLAACQAESKVLWDLNPATKTVQARSFTTPSYGRIWNSDIITKLMELQADGWRVPPARPAADDPRARQATEADCLQNRMDIGIKPGDMVAPAGLYMGEKDLFAFMVNEGRPIDAGGGSRLHRGFFAENSEVGGMSYWITEFLYNSVCGNHIVWDAREVKTTRVVHIGVNAASRAWAASAEAWGRLKVEITEYANESVSDIEAKIKVARTIEFGANKQEVVELLYGKRIPGLSKEVLEASYDLAEQFPADGGNAAPTSKWGMVQGITRLSQRSAFADKRVEIDKAAGKVMELAVR